MKIKTKLAPKLAIVALAAVLSMNLSGCMLSLACWPLWIPGAVLLAGGMVVSVEGGSSHRSDSKQLLGSGLALGLVGFILGTDDPGHSDALNPLPHDETVAKTAGVTVDDIEDYNRNLLNVREVGLQLAKELRTQVHRIDLKSISALKDIINDSEINQLARNYGFENTQEFIGTFKMTRFPKEKIEAFADATHLSVPQSKLLLRYGFGIQI
jgi:hypothetical protein